MVASSSNGPINMLLSSPMAQWVSMGIVFVGTAFPEICRKTMQEGEKVFQWILPVLLSGYKPAVAPSSGNDTTDASTDSDWTGRQVHWWRDLASRTSDKDIVGLAAAGLVLVYRLCRARPLPDDDLVQTGDFTATMSRLGRDLASLRDEIKLLRQDMVLLRLRAQRHESTTRTEYQEQLDTAAHVELLVSAAAESTAMLPDDVPVDSLLLHELEVFPEHWPQLPHNAEIKSAEEEGRSLDDTPDHVDLAMDLSTSLQRPSNPDQIQNPDDTVDEAGDTVNVWQ
jgi:hypothetical protein